MTECGEPNGANPACRPLAPHVCGGPAGHAMPHGCRCGKSWSPPPGAGHLTRDRLAFLGLWIRRSGVSEGNLRIQWIEMTDAERAAVYAWADRELGTPPETPTTREAA